MKIELTETEIIHIMDSLRMRVQDLRDCDDAETADLANELEELEHDLFEASARPGDWTEDVEPTEIAEGFSFAVAEDHMIQTGIDAREQLKASSRAAERRALNFSAARDDGDLSETQKHDLWSKPSNDPADW
jgi:hypothetical protein